MPLRRASKPPPPPGPSPSTTMRKSLPLLSVTPVNMSLTEGTNIPEPEPDPDPVPPPAIDTSVLQTKNKIGPLSSHPITPVDTAEDPNKTVPMPLSSTTDVSTANGNHLFREDDKNSGVVDPPRVRPRRPSFASRLLGGMRSRSSLGVFGESSANLAQSADSDARPSTPGSELRGLKRNAPPSANGSMTTASTSRQSFPGMIRRKSMELFGTSRRKSGLWTAADLTAMDQEKRREAYMEDREDRRSKKPRLPMLPEMSAIGNGINGGVLGGEELFANIGR